MSLFRPGLPTTGHLRRVYLSSGVLCLGVFLVTMSPEGMSAVGLAVAVGWLAFTFALS